MSKILSLKAMEKLMKRAAPGFRIGNDAKKQLKDILEEIGEEIAQRASQAAKHAKRKTIKASDIKLAKR